MKAINITPEVIKLEKKLLKDKNLKVAGYMLDQALNKEQIQIFREEDGKIFWFENRNAAKYAVKHMRHHIIKYMKLEYRDDWKEKNVKDFKKAVKEGKVKVNKVDAPKKVVKKEGAELPSVVDEKVLAEFVKKYMNGYKIPKEFKKAKLSEEEQSKCFAELGKSLTESLSKFVKKIYGGDKANFRNKSKMSAEERKEYNLNNHQEFDWYLNTLIFLASPATEYIEKFGKFSTANYRKVTGDLRSVVVNSLFANRTKAAF